LTLPASVKRLERIKLQAIVFNYEASDAIVNVSMTHKYDGDDQSNRSKSEIDLKANESQSLDFWILCDQVGWIEFTVSADKGQFVDQVIRRILVHPEGEQQHESQSMLIQLNQTDRTFGASFKLHFPKHAVSDSKRLKVSVTGDLFGKTLDNLNRLVRVPCGCGEQNMVNFVPNCLVYSYLQKLNKLKPEIKLKLMKNSRIGYARELQYQRLDGGFSAFGESDANASTWLTAFVLKSFAEAQDLLSIDDQVIRRAVDWLTQQRNPIGSYRKVGFVHDRAAMGGMDESDGKKRTDDESVALTAYVAIALNCIRKAGWTDPPPHLESTVKYLENQLQKAEQLNCYTLVLVTYALHLLESDVKDEAWRRVWSLRQQSVDSLFWSNITQPKSDRKSEKVSVDSNALETTAYVALTIMQRLQSETDDALRANCFKAVSYLIENQNEFGAFRSTQDTVIGLQALCSFAAQLPTGSETSLKVRFLNDQNRFLGQVEIDEQNKIANQTVECSEFACNERQTSAIELRDLLKSAEDVTIKVQVEGVGLAVVQLNTQYNTSNKSESETFQLKVAKVASQRDLQLLIDLKHNQDSRSNMILLEVELPSGYQADLAETRLYQQRNASLIQRIETKRSDQVIVYYFESLQAHQNVQVQAHAFETTAVQDRKAAVVRVYDYYCDRDFVRQFYTI
jgi:CD109 antigen